MASGFSLIQTGGAPILVMVMAPVSTEWPAEWEEALVSEGTAVVVVQLAL
jgi:hypothetical protein